MDYQKILTRINLSINAEQKFDEETKKAMKIIVVHSLWNQMSEDILEMSRRRNEVGDIQVGLLESVNFKPTKR